MGDANRPHFMKVCTMYARRGPHLNLYTWWTCVFFTAKEIFQGELNLNFDMGKLTPLAPHRFLEQRCRRNWVRQRRSEDGITSPRGTQMPYSCHQRWKRCWTPSRKDKRQGMTPSPPPPGDLQKEPAMLVACFLQFQTKCVHWPLRL